MMSKVMDTSQWIGFFRKAGLPANVAANYALIFSDNRIQVGMLLDLSKEYLYDMGIKVMGDVIAILKYAKEFHNQLAKERIIGNPSVITNKTAVAERMVGRYTRPVALPPARPSIVNTGSPRKSTVISLKRKALPESHVKKVRRVPPEEEGAYNIKMPMGITEKTRKILQQQGAKRSVFARLGDSAVSSSTDSKVSSSVFERLGPSNKSVCDDMPSSTVTSDPVRPRKTATPLQYQGVLKMTVGKNRTVTTTNLTRTVLKPRVNPVLRKTVRLNQINSILEGRKPVRTVNQSQGIFGQAIADQKLSVKSRLGGKVDARNLARTKLLFKNTKNSTVFDRLGR